MRKVIVRITWHVAWIVIGLGVIALYLAFYFREGPATRCEYKLPDWRECVVLQDPRPFLAAGFLLLTAGVIGNRWAANRRSTPRETPRPQTVGEAARRS